MSVILIKIVFSVHYAHSVSFNGYNMKYLFNKLWCNAHYNTKAPYAFSMVKLDVIFVKKKYLKT